MSGDGGRGGCEKRHGEWQPARDDRKLDRIERAYSDISS
jgi:hypothetical protein